MRNLSIGLLPALTRNRLGMHSFPLRLRQRLLLAVALAMLGGTIAPAPVHAGPASVAPVALLTQALPGPQDTAVPPRQSAEQPLEPVEPTGFMAAADRVTGRVNGVIETFFFFDIAFWDDDVTLPLVVAWLVIGAVFFTVRMGFINVRAFRHALNVTAGKYTDPASPGEVSHFQALTTALSATVGLGNIAGVAIAVSIGGPGATFWMIVAGLLGMTTKFVECTLGQQYRSIGPDGKVLGGPMQYLSKGFAEGGWPKVGKVLAVAFAILCIGGSIGGGNSFQVNQSLNALQETVPFLADAPWVYGLVMAVLVGIVIIGGIRRIAKIADKVVPLMALIYVAGALIILFTNITLIPAAFGTILTAAFTSDAAYGGFIGVLVMGFRRAAFSNEAGAGSAAIAHSAAKTAYPVREGIVALLEPFIDTVVICTMTALVIVITGAYNNPAYATIIEAQQGAALTSRAMGEQLPWFPYVLSSAVFLFAYSTMISWSYYGERCWVWMFGERSSMTFRVIFLVFTFLGSIITAQNVLGFGDLMILGMAFPNLIGVYFLHGKVKRELDGYWAKYKSGELARFK